MKKAVRKLRKKHLKSRNGIKCLYGGTFLFLWISFAGVPARMNVL